MEQNNQSAFSELAKKNVEDQFLLMADTSPVMLWMAREDGRCTFFNKTWLQFTGRSLAQEIDYGWSEGVFPEDFQKCMDTFVTSLNSRKAFSMEYRLRNHSGQYRWLLDQGVPHYKSDGTFIGYIGSCTDIHDRKLLEQERSLLLSSELKARNQAERLCQRAEEVNRIKDEFFASVSHELRTPLNSILGWSELILSGEIAENELKSAIQNIINSAQSQLRLVNDLVDVSQINFGKMKLDLGKTRFTNILNLTLASVAFSIQNKKISFEAKEENGGFESDPNRDLIVCDQVRIQQVLWNVLSNAIKFTPIKGWIKLIWKRTENELEITVTDSGLGISPEFLPFVFERFRQESAGTTRTYSGLGLGLSITKTILELHGGHIEASSKGRNQGATLKITLPVFVKDLSIPQTERNLISVASSLKQFELKKSKLLAGLKVLVVDDQEEFLVILSRILERYSALVLKASNVAQAVQIVDEQHPDIILSDISMPKEDGYDFIRKLKILLPLKGWSIPVVALTAHSNSEDIEHALALGFSMHLAKPVARELLIKSITTLVGRNNEYKEEFEQKAP
jgi:PAS domain S-box-containing protein